VGTANKCLQGLPAISFVLIQQEQVKRLLTINPRSLYLSLATYLQNAEPSLPFTPAVQIAYALREALDELLEEGVAQRISRYRQAADLLRRGFTQMDLRFLLPESLRSNTITSLYLPEGITYNTLHDRLREKGYIIYAGQGQLQSEIFRVANMGHLTQEDFRGFLEQLALVLKECR
jgi:2-aminoethylphosphonate-pyruvate transaminase